MDPITVAMGLAQFAPQIIKWITGSDKAADAASKVVEVAQVVTGKQTGEDALAALNADPNAVIAFRQALAAQEAELDKAFLADVQSARERDAKLRESGQRNYRADFMFLLAVIVVGVLTWLVWRSGDLSEYTKGVFTLVLGRFLGYLDSIFNFEFGSTRSNKTKDTTIEQLSRR